MQVDDLNNKLEKSISNLIIQYKEYCYQLSIRLENLNPKKVLERGYSISYIDGKIIKNINQVNIKSELRTEIASGTILSTINRKKGKKDAKTN